MSHLALFPSLAPKFLTAAVDNATSSTDSLVLGIIIWAIVIILVISILLIVSNWKIFQKAGKPGWASIVPFYSNAVLLEITGLPLWWIILLLVPIVNLVIVIIMARRLAGVFGKGVGFTWGLILLPFIFYPILAFGKSTYANTYPPSRPISEAVKWSLLALGAFLLIEIFFLQLSGGSRTYRAPLTVLPGDGGYATDGTYVYDNDQVIQGADPDSFTPKGEYATDDSSVYYGGTLVKDADPSTFAFVPDPTDPSDPDSEYAKDATHVYDEGLVIQGADPASFVVLGYGYSKDAMNVYYPLDTNDSGDDASIAADVPIPSADVATFQVITDSDDSDSDTSPTYDAKDKNHYYSEGEVVPGDSSSNTH